MGLEAEIHQPLAPAPLWRVVAITSDLEVDPQHLEERAEQRFVHAGQQSLALQRLIEKAHALCIRLEMWCTTIGMFKRLPVLVGPCADNLDFVDGLLKS